ncbi:MAG: hypothetical protein U9Q77_10365 [Candidatus Marinimicrobia bacterium]|nr:hypothetical protein [Candidatus Neomarinimicrobiota bacterium]
MKLKMLLIGVVLLLPLLTFGQGITVTTGSGLDVVLDGEVELEFVDVEGPGGFKNQDLTYQKVKNRSPHMRIDKAILGLRVNYSENLYYKFELRFGDDRAKVDIHYARLKIPSINTRFEMGKNKPMVATKRRSEGMPLIGTAFWKGREYHITSKTKVELGNIGVTGEFSFAMKRPLGTDDAAEDKSFKMLVYDDYDPKNGQTFEYGAALGLNAYGLTAEGWYYTGKLIDDFDWKTSLGFLPGYDDVADQYGDEDDLTHWWYGGRLTMDLNAVRLRTEYISAMDGLLPRNGYYAEGSYRINLNNGANLEPIIRYGVLNVDRHPPVLGDPATWDRNMTTIALLSRLNSYLTLKLEYYILNEVTGGSVQTDEVTGITVDNSLVNDDQMLLQINFEF